MKSFTINKNKFKKSEAQPDYKMSIKMGEEFVEIGGCWLKDGKSGKFFSCKLNDVYVDNVKGVARKGFQITEDGMTDHAKAMPPMKDEEYTQEIPF